MKIGDRIAQYRKVRGLTQGQLGDRIGVVKQTIGNYERGDRQPTHDIILRIADVLDVDPAKLYGMPIQDTNDAATPGERLTNYMVVFGDTAADLSLLLNISLEDVGRICADDLDLTPAQAKIIADRYGHINPALFLSGDEDGEESLPSNVRPISDLHHQRIPMIGGVAAGEPIYDPEEAGIYVDSPVKADAAITIHGDSMEPTYLEGDVVYIKCVPDVPEGAVAVVFLDDEATIKHVYKRPTGLTLWSDNPAHMPFQIEYEDYARVRIFGVPVGYTRIYKSQAAIKKGL